MKLKIPYSGIKRCLLLSFFLSLSGFVPAFSQSSGPSDGIKRLVSTLSARQESDAMESVYVHLDKSVYAAADTLWYKAYVFDASKLTSPAKSGILHIDVLNAENEVVKRFLVPLAAGLGWGHLPLTQAGLSGGQYTLKAYTNWMLNFGERLIFSRVFEVEPTTELAGSVTQASVSKTTMLNTEKKKSADQKDQQDYDVQFLPEGGYLVAGIETTIGCKVMSAQGRGVSLSGKILNGKDEAVADFRTSERGMGSFKFQPVAGQKYTANVTLPGNLKRNYSFPELKLSGTVLNVKNDPDSSQLSILISRSASVKAQRFYLIMSCRVGAYAVDIDLREETEQMIQISKTKFPSGIVRISLLNEAQMSLNERMIFINHQDFLNMEIAAEKDSYGRRDSIGMLLSVKDIRENALVGSFSISVSDDSQVNADSLIGGNILTEMLLRSGVKGDFEAAAYYMEDHPEAAKALDVLLLTQGWTAFDWQGLFISQEMKFKAEPHFEIQGRVVGAFNGAKSGRKVALLSTKPIFVKDTVTDERGYFTFKELPLFEAPVFQIRTSNNKDKSFNLHIEVDERQFPDFKEKDKRPKQISYLPPAPNEELSRLKAIKQKIDGLLLNEVIINAVKTVNKSDNLNGSGQADQVLNEADLNKEGQATLLEVLEKRIKGFKLTLAGAAIFNQPVKFIFDGMDLEFGEPLSAIDLRSTLSAYSIESVTGLEVAVNMKYTNKYNFKHQENSHLISYVDGGPSYIEITTRSKKGPFSRKSNGMYLYRSLPFSLPLQEFYVPKYRKAKVAADAPDLRSTLYWNPNILTDAEGKASFSFWTSDVPGTYTLTIEGSDMAGNLGFFKRKIKVE